MPAGAAIDAGRGRVMRMAVEHDIDIRADIGPGQTSRRILAGHGGAVGQPMPERIIEMRAQAEKLSVRIDGEFAFDLRTTALRRS